jgi:UDP-hydrolysing UDP-N-acetyl-D-glucosamine 2-epimerase
VKRKICVVTGSRAEYGLLRWVMEGIKNHPDLTLQLVVTGTHLSSEFGNTYTEIENDGFIIDKKVPILNGIDTPQGIAMAMGAGMVGFEDALSNLKPDCILVLGDRFEIMSVAQVSVLLQIPIVHLCGGDIGSGTFDNIFRDCISKMADLHFVTHNEAKTRLKSIGVADEYIHNVGSTSIDGILRLPLLDIEDLENDLEIKFEKLIVLMTFHPLTRSTKNSMNQLEEVFKALKMLSENFPTTVVITGSNSDNGGIEINEAIQSYVGMNENFYFFRSLGHLRYLSLLKCATFVIGNSSSGIYEAPYLQTFTVNIGERQEGRAAPASVFHCQPKAEEIYRLSNLLISEEFVNIEMIYGSGGASSEIVRLSNEFLRAS